MTTQPDSNPTSDRPTRLSALGSRIGATSGALVLLFLASLTLPKSAYAFPEMVRHAYTSCATCHVSPDGGGLVTGYGRALSGEVLSTWHTETEAEFLYGAIPTPEYLSFGGQFRVIQTYVNNAAIERADLILMQADVEAGVTIAKNFTVVGTFGYDEVNGQFLSRRHYLRYQPDLKQPIYMRAGRFFSSYGVHFPDHVMMAKSRLGIGQPMMEPYTFEFSYLGPEYQILASGFLGRPDDPAVDTGTSVAVWKVLSKSAKAGISGGFFDRLTNKRLLVGPSAIIGFTPELFLLTEWNFGHVTTKSSNAKAWASFAYGRLDYEFITGVHVYAVTELGKTNLSLPNLSQGFGGGMQFFPRPHIELRAEYQRQRGDLPAWSDVAWVMGYYYL